MILTKCVTLLSPLFIILSIFEARSYHGYSSYREYYKYHADGVNFSMVSKMAKNYKEEDIQIAKHFDENNQADFKSDFIFPDDNRLRNDGRNYAETRISETTLRCGDGQPFCEDVRDYPEELVNRILEENPNLYAYAFEDTVPIDVRLDSFDDVKELCPYTGHDIVPEMAESINGEWLFIVQSEKMNFRQRIHVETCRQINSTCQIIDDKLPEGYYPRCKQKYVYRQLVAINGNQKTVHASFPFPASCCCHLYFHTEIKGQNQI